MSKELEALKIGIPKLKKLYENSAKKMSSNDILGFDLTFLYLDKALQDYDELLKHIKRWHDLLLKSGIDSKGIVADEIENYWAIKAGV